MAFSDIDTNDFRVRIGRLYGLSAGTHVRPVFDGGGFTLVDPIDAETATGIAAWWAENVEKWFIAFLATDDDQPLRVYSSSDSLAWTLVGDNGTSLLGPRIDRWAGNRAMLFSAR